MKELYKWFLAICCAVVMIITGPSTNVSATDINTEDIAVDPGREEILEESLAEQIDAGDTIIAIPDEEAMEQEVNLEQGDAIGYEDEVCSDLEVGSTDSGYNALFAATSSYSPYPNIEYGYTTSVKAGTIRYISQVPGGANYNANYWPANAFGGYASPTSECGTASISMSLSYIGINKTPKDILNANNGYTVFGSNWGGATFLSPALSTAISNYISGNGKYSPPIIHLPKYSSAGHYLIIIGKISNTSYQVLDPWQLQVSSVNINGTSASYSKSGTTITDTIDAVYQYYNPNTPVDTIPPTIEDVYIKDIDKNGYTIHCIVRDNVGLGRVEFPTWTSNADSSGNKQDDIIWGSAGAVAGKAWELNYRVKYSDHNNERNCIYYTDIYCYDAAGKLSTYKTVTHYSDDIAPTITNIEITEITSEGYRITCTVTDNIQVSKVSFPAWTARAVSGTDQDDIKWGEGTLSGNKATFYVKRSDHNGEYGLYHNHIYAHDAAENITSVIAPSVTVPDPRLQNDSDSPVKTGRFNGHKYEVYDLSLGWKAAKSFCEEHGGHLVTITNSEENEFVSQLIRQGSKGYYHIGCSDEESEGNWGWITGEQFSYNNWDPQGEPSGNTTENWAMIVSIDNPPNKQFGEWVDMPEKAEDVGYYNYANSGFVCEYEMEERDLSNCQITLDEEEFNYTGTAKEPNVTVRYGDSFLSEGTDYYVSYSKNVNAGDAIVTITGMGNYSGSHSKIFTISAASLSSATVSDISNKTYNGSAQTQSPTVKANGKILVNGTDYTLSYANNINAGTATITITGKGNYTGKVSRTFSIAKAAPTLMFKSATLLKKAGDDAFTNSLTKTTDGTVTFTSSNTSVATVNSTSGLVTIKGAGETTITASASAGTNYKAGSASYTLIVTAQATAGFSDVQDPSHPYYKAIYWAAEEGITKGYSDGTFGINRSCTRGEMMMFLWKYARKPAPKYTSNSPFKDVSNSHAFYKAILWGYQKGITKGYSDGSFGIDRNVSRGEAMMFLWRLKDRPAPQTASKSPFTDVPTTHAFYKAILWGSQNGITKGYTTGANKGKFGINDNCTRGQIVTFLYRAK